MTTKQYFEARKLLNKRKEGEHEFQEWHVIKADLDYNYIEELFNEWYDSDWEYAYNHGFSYNSDGDLFSVDVNQVLDELYDKEIDEADDEDEVDKIKQYQSILEKYKDYTLYVEEEKA